MRTSWICSISVSAALRPLCVFVCLAPVLMHTGALAATEQQSRGACGWQAGQQTSDVAGCGIIGTTMDGIYSFAECNELCQQMDAAYCMHYLFYPTYYSFDYADGSCSAIKEAEIHAENCRPPHSFSEDYTSWQVCKGFECGPGTSQAGDWNREHAGCNRKPLGLFDTIEACDAECKLSHYFTPEDSYFPGSKCAFSGASRDSADSRSNCFSYTESVYNDCDGPPMDTDIHQRWRVCLDGLESTVPAQAEEETYTPSTVAECGPDSAEGGDWNWQHTGCHHVVLGVVDSLEDCDAACETASGATQCAISKTPGYYEYLEERTCFAYIEDISGDCDGPVIDYDSFLHWRLCEGDAAVAPAAGEDASQHAEEGDHDCPPLGFECTGEPNGCDYEHCTSQGCWSDYVRLPGYCCGTPLPCSRMDSEAECVDQGCVAEICSAPPPAPAPSPARRRRTGF